MTKPKYITIPEIAKILGISRIAAYKKVKKGEIPAVRVGRIYMISDRDITTILNKSVTAEDKRQIDKAVKKVVLEYGEVLKKLAKE
jgi:excisionase family DNA binding protein